eukprot:snap_masked-scaffold_24-processed-gene-4.25-mRNA-1 protein AED:1.00 eAED:1.00 QI:0/-1/0/0/-1/1/1/0/381
MSEPKNQRKRFTRIKLITSPSGFRQKLSDDTPKTSSGLDLYTPNTEKVYKFTNGNHNSITNIRKKGNRWLQFKKRTNYHIEAVTLNDLDHQTFIESLENIEKHKVQKTNYAQNCISVFEDEKILSLVSPRKSLKKCTKVVFKTNLKNLKEQISGTLILLHGTVHFNTEEGETVFSADIMDIKSLRYNGQQKKILGFSCFARGNKKENNGHHNLSISRVLIECNNQNEAKSWIAALLLEIERVGDAIFLCMENMKNVYKADSFSQVNFPHMECLLRKRVHLYEVSLLEDSHKLNDARIDLCEFLQDKQRFEAAEEFSRKIDLFSRKRKHSMDKKNWQNGFIENIRSMSDIGLIKQEIELQALRFTHRKKKEESLVVLTPNFI